VRTSARRFPAKIRQNCNTFQFQQIRTAIRSETKTTLDLDRGECHTNARRIGSVVKYASDLHVNWVFRATAGSDTRHRGADLAKTSRAIGTIVHAPFDVFSNSGAAASVDRPARRQDRRSGGGRDRIGRPGGYPARVCQIPVSRKEKGLKTLRAAMSPVANFDACESKGLRHLVSV